MLSAINSSSYHVEPIQPVSRHNGSAGIIADVPKNKTSFSDYEDKFERAFTFYLESYNSSGTKKNSGEANAKSASSENEAVLSRNSTHIAHSSNKKKSHEDSEQHSVGEKSLSAEEQKEVDKLKKIDREVRAHERAHQAAAGGLAKGGASFSFQQGPDGNQYAVAGEVSIDMSPIPGNPTATIQKMQQVKRAAMAPADPSAQDRSVASKAQQMEAQARRELLQEQSDGKADAVIPKANNSMPAATGLYKLNIDEIRKSMFDKYNIPDVEPKIVNSTVA